VAALQGAVDAKPEHDFGTEIPFMWYGFDNEPARRVLSKHKSFGGHQGNHHEQNEEQTIYLQPAMIVDLRRKVSS
jgi:hypothetical protein